MASIEIFSNNACMPTGEKVPFVAPRNFYSAIAACEEYANHSVTFIASQIAVIPLSDDKRLVVTL